MLNSAEHGIQTAQTYVHIEIAKIEGISRLNHRNQSFILLKNLKNGISTFMSRINFMLSGVENKKIEKKVYNIWPLAFFMQTVKC